MDLGFGAQNQIIGQMAQKVVLEGAQQQEAQLDADMAKYDELMNDEDALEKLRAKRLDQVRRQPQDPYPQPLPHSKFHPFLHLHIP